MNLNLEKIGIVGSGLIGRSWAMLFISAGYNVTIYDVESAQVDNAVAHIQQEIKSLETNNALRANHLSADKQLTLISRARNLSECLMGANYIQECVPENLELKLRTFEQVDSLAQKDTILASSTSTFMPSILSENLKNRNNMIVVHPVNPPYFVPLVEIVPAPWTDQQVITKTKQIMNDIGQCPIILNKEIPGFALNRIQYVILNECWHLIKGGVLNVEDVDKVMSQGLGMRYAFLGPLETAHLNAQGMTNYCERYSKSIYDVSKTVLPPAKFEGEMVKVIASELASKTPLDKLQERREWRDKCLLQLSLLKKKMQ